MTMKLKKGILFVATMFLLVACGEKKEERPKAPANHPLYTVELTDRVLTADYAATIKGCQTVEIRPQVSGMITDIHINEGDIVGMGKVLFVIDQAPYQAAYEIAVANVKSAEAALSTAQLLLDSNQELYEQDVISEFDLMMARNDLVEAEAKLALAQAEETNARNNLSYTEVKSPVNGVASMIPYRVGALVNSNITTPLVTVSDDSQVYAYFSMAENQMLDLIHQYGSLQKAIKEMPEVELRMSNGDIYEYKGRINAISGTISESTGSVSLRASFPNRGRLLRDGSSGTVLIPYERHNCIVIPQSATYELQDRIFTYRVVDGYAVSTPIQVMSLNNGTEYIVEEGLKEGDVIIAEGAGLVRDGAKVVTTQQSVEE